MIEDQIKKIICRQLGVSEDKITSNTNIVEELHPDSLDITELLLEMEQEFQVAIEDDEFEKVITINDLAKIIKEKQ